MTSQGSNSAAVGLGTVWAPLKGSTLMQRNLPSAAQKSWHSGDRLRCASWIIFSTLSLLRSGRMGYGGCSRSASLDGSLATPGSAPASLDAARLAPLLVTRAR